VRKEISIFFSDIRGFTRIIERMRPEETLSFVNEYLAAAEPEIHGAGGFVDTYLGDGIMALFDRGADSAVRGGVAMHRALARYNDARRARGLDPVRTGVGINTGQVTLGTLGGQNALKCGVVGDPVNLAARIEGLTKRYAAGILISEHTFKALASPADYTIRRVGRVQVVGKLAPVTIYEVVDGDDDDLRAQKNATRGMIEDALDHYYARRPEEALTLFKRCMSAAPDDVLPQLFVSSCRALISDGIPPEWDGIERLSEKSSRRSRSSPSRATRARRTPTGSPSCAAGPRRRRRTTAAAPRWSPAPSATSASRAPPPTPCATCPGSRCSRPRTGRAPRTCAG